MSCAPCNYSAVNADPTNETLPSALSNFIDDFYGDLTKTVVDGQVTWELPCNLATGLENFPREEGEGLGCYLLRTMADLYGQNPSQEEGEPLNVYDFGAVGDGVADDTAAIQDALDAAIVSGITSNGREVYIPKGTFKITDLIYIPSNVVVRIHGRLVAAPLGPNQGFYQWSRMFQNYLQAPGGNQTVAANKKDIDPTTGDPTGYVSQNISILGDGLGSIVGLAQDGIEMFTSGGALISGYRTVNTLFFFNVDRVTIQGLRLEEAKGWNVALIGCKEATVRGCSILGGNGTSSVYRDGSFQDGIHLDVCNNCLVTGNYVRASDDCVAISTHVLGHFNDLTYARSRRIRVVDNALEQVSPTGSLANGYLTSANNFRLMVAYGSNAEDVNHQRYIEDIVFSNNVCKCQAHSIYFEMELSPFSNQFPASNSDRYRNITVSNNIFDQRGCVSGVSSGNKFLRACLIEAASGCLFQGNIFIGHRRQYLWMMRHVQDTRFAGNQYVGSFGINGFDASSSGYALYVVNPKTTGDNTKFERNTISNEVVYGLPNMYLRVFCSATDVGFSVNELVFKNCEVRGWNQTGSLGQYLFSLSPRVDKTNRRSTVGNFEIWDSKFSGGRTGWISFVQDAITGSLVTTNQPVVRVQNCTIENFTEDGDVNQYGIKYAFDTVTGLSRPYGSVEVVNSVFRHVPGDAVNITAAEGLLVKGCTFDDIGFETVAQTNRRGVSWNLSFSSLSLDFLNGKIVDNDFLLDGKNVRPWRVGRTYNTGDLVLVPHAFVVDGSFTGSQVFQYAGAGPLVASTTNLPVVADSNWTFIRNGGVGFYVAAYTTSATFQGRQILCANNANVSGVGVLYSVDPNRRLIYPVDIPVDALPVSGFHMAPGWRFRYNTPVSGGAEGVVCVSAGYVVREAWNIATAYNPGDCVSNAGNLYLALAAVTGGSAPVHGSGDVGSWRFMVVSTAADLKNYGVVA